MDVGWPSNLRRRAVASPALVLCALSEDMMLEKLPHAKSIESLPVYSSGQVDQAQPTVAQSNSKLILEDLLRATPADNRVIHWEQIRSVGLEF